MFVNILRRHLHCGAPHGPTRLPQMAPHLPGMYEFCWSWPSTPCTILFLYSTHSGPPSNFCFCSILVPFSFPRMCSSPPPRPVFYQYHFHSIRVLDLPLWSPPWALLPNTAPKASHAISPLLLWSSKSPTGWLSPPDGMGIDYCQYQSPLS